MKFTPVQAAAAKALAVRYNAFEDARKEYAANPQTGANSVVVWGRLLKAAQDGTGIELQTPEVIDRLMDLAQQTLYGKHHAS